MESLARSIERFVDGFANSSASFGVPVQGKKQQIADTVDKNVRPFYMMKEDNYIDGIINSPLIKASLRGIADKYYSNSVEDTIKVSTLVTASSYPNLHQILTRCCKSLRMYDIPEVYVTSRLRGINALSMEVKHKKFILVSRQTTISLSELEQAFLLGHELGHHQQGNLVCHTVNGLMNSMNARSEIFGPLLSDTVEVPLKRWCRLSEFNADRAGYICCKDINTIRQLFLKLGMIEKPSAYHLFEETGEDHPLLSTRFNELQEFVTTNRHRLCL